MLYNALELQLSHLFGIPGRSVLNEPLVFSVAVQVPVQEMPRADAKTAPPATLAFFFMACGTEHSNYISVIMSNRGLIWSEESNEGLAQNIDG